MRCIGITAAVGFVLCLASSPALANLYTSSANPSDLYPLPHELNYEWGIRWAVPDGERIIAATLTINNLWEWSGDPFNQLFISLLEKPALLRAAACDLTTLSSALTREGNCVLYLTLAVREHGTTKVSIQ